jgi:hypothetical protein
MVHSLFHQILCSPCRIYRPSVELSFYADINASCSQPSDFTLHSLLMTALSSVSGLHPRLNFGTQASIRQRGRRVPSAAATLHEPPPSTASSSAPSNTARSSSTHKPMTIDFSSSTSVVDDWSNDDNDFSAVGRRRVAFSMKAASAPGPMPPPSTSGFASIAEEDEEKSEENSQKNKPEESLLAEMSQRLSIRSAPIRVRQLFSLSFLTRNELCNHHFWFSLFCFVFFGQEAADCVLSHLLHRLQHYPSMELGPTQIDSALSEEWDGTLTTSASADASVAVTSPSTPTASSSALDASSAVVSSSMDSWRRLHFVIDNKMLLTLMQKPALDSNTRMFFLFSKLGFNFGRNARTSIMFHFCSSSRSLDCSRYEW